MQSMRVRSLIGKNGLLQIQLPEIYQTSTARTSRKRAILMIYLLDTNACIIYLKGKSFLLLLL